MVVTGHCSEHVLDMVLVGRDTLTLLLGDSVPSARMLTYDCRCLLDDSDRRDLLGDDDAPAAAVTVRARDAAVLRPLAARFMTLINIRRRS